MSLLLYWGQEIAEPQWSKHFKIFLFTGNHMISPPFKLSRPGWTWALTVFWNPDLKNDQMLSPEIKWSKPGILTMVVSGSQLLGYISWSDIPPAFCFIYLIKKNSTHKNNNNSDTVWFLPRRNVARGKGLAPCGYRRGTNREAVLKLPDLMPPSWLCNPASWLHMTGSTSWLRIKCVR